MEKYVYRKKYRGQAQRTLFTLQARKHQNYWHSLEWSEIFFENRFGILIQFAISWEVVQSDS